jgi:hypothetical protein
MVSLIKLARAWGRCVSSVIARAGSPFSGQAIAAGGRCGFDPNGENNRKHECPQEADEWAFRQAIRKTVAHPECGDEAQQEQIDPSPIREIDHAPSVKIRRADDGDAASDGRSYETDIKDNSEEDGEQDPQVDVLCDLRGKDIASPKKQPDQTERDRDHEQEDDGRKGGAHLGNLRRILPERRQMPML